MEIKNKDLKRRIIDISYKLGLSHLGSCLTAVDIIDEIYAKKKPQERFVLSSGHAGLALYVVLEKYAKSYPTRSAEEIFRHHGVHPDRCGSCGIDCSSGSLGNGLPIALGMALSDRNKNVYCLISDGECAEGSISESLRIAKEQKVDNLKVYLNFNGWAAYKETQWGYIPPGIEYLRSTEVDYLPFLSGQAGHYKAMNEKEYESAVKTLS